MMHPTNAEEFQLCYERWQRERLAAARAGGDAWKQSNHDAFDLLIDGRLIIEEQARKIAQLRATLKTAAQYIEEVTG